MLEHGTHPKASALNIVMLDFESTGLGSDEGFHPLELAAIIVDENLEVLGTFGPRLFHVEPEVLEGMNDYVKNMHTETGLIERLRSDARFTAPEMDRLFSCFIAPFFPEPGSLLEDGTKFKGAQIGGNSLAGVDLPAIRQFMPETQELLGYRTVDVSCVAETLRRIAPGVVESMPRKASDHTAMTDIEECIKELRYYREALKLNS